METTTLASQFPQYVALILFGAAFAWYLRWSRSVQETRDAAEAAERERIATLHAAEREDWRKAAAEQAALWREFLTNQQAEWRAQLDQVVIKFRDTLREDREESLAELRKLGDALNAHDQHAQDVAQRVAEVLAGKLVETAKGTVQTAGGGA